MLLNPVPDDDKSAQGFLAVEDQRLNKLINDIRGKVGAWRAGGYRGVTATTLRLLEHWADETACKVRPFFAQREAMETLIWLREAATRSTPERRDLEARAAERNDGLVRHAVKMATGTGKTAVMAMLIAWQTLNAARTRRRRNLRHGQRFLVLTPGVTIKDRLQELKPSSPHNVYDEMGLVPRDLRWLLNRARVEVVNFQAFVRRDLNTVGFPRSAPASARAHRELIGTPGDEGRESDVQAVRRVLAGLLDAGAYGDVVVINDEAHHCYLPSQEGGTRRSRGSGSGGGSGSGSAGSGGTGTGSGAGSGIGSGSGSGTGSIGTGTGSGSSGSGSGSGTGSIGTGTGSGSSGSGTGTGSGSSGSGIGTGSGSGIGIGSGSGTGSGSGAGSGAGTGTGSGTGSGSGGGGATGDGRAAV